MVRLGVLVCLTATACGRLHFDNDDDDDDARPLDATVCDDNLPGVLFCEGFEGTPQLTIDEATAPSTVGPDTMQVYRGARSLHSRATRVSEPAWQVGTVLPSVTTGMLYVRWYQYVPAG